LWGILHSSLCLKRASGSILQPLGFTRGGERVEPQAQDDSMNRALTRVGTVGAPFMAPAYSAGKMPTLRRDIL